MRRLWKVLSKAKTSNNVNGNLPFKGERVKKPGNKNYEYVCCYFQNDQGKCHL